MQEILDFLLAEKEDDYAEFQRKLMPTVTPEKVLGVRTPKLRAYAKTLIKNEELCEAFFAELPHEYFDEYQIHVFALSLMKDYDKCMEYTEDILPHIDNWATCDQFSPKVFKKHKDLLLVKINEWINSDKTYTVRFAIGMLMEHFLDEDFDEKYLYVVASVKSEEYYINMMIAWYFATALAKQWDATILLIESKSLDKWVQNKSIQKARESYRITKEQKEYLKTLKL